MKRFNADSSSSESELPPPARKKCRAASDSESDESDEAVARGRSDLVLTNLMMFQGEETADDSYAENGKNPKRIKEALRSNLCKCSRNCRKAVSFEVVFKLCTMFWSLPKGAQDAVLWGIQTVSFQRKHQNGETNSGSSDEGDNTGSSDSEYSCSNSSSSSSAERKNVNNWYIQGGETFEPCLGLLRNNTFLSDLS